MRGSTRRRRHIPTLLGAPVLACALLPGVANAQDVAHFHTAPSTATGPSLEAEEACNMTFGVTLMRTGEFMERETPGDASEVDLIVLLSAREVLGTWFFSGRAIDAAVGETVWRSDTTTSGEASSFLSARGGCTELAQHFLIHAGTTTPANVAVLPQLPTAPPHAAPISPSPDTSGESPFEELEHYVDLVNQRQLAGTEWSYAASLFDAACDDGQMLGCAGLGRLYRDGQGVTQDYQEAIAHYQLACDAGLAESCNNVGRMYREGQGVHIDQTQAAVYFRQACDGGDIEGCDNLGRRYQRSGGGMQDIGRMVGFYQRACDRGVMSGAQVWAAPITEVTASPKTMLRHISSTNVPVKAPTWMAVHASESSTRLVSRYLGTRIRRWRFTPTRVRAEQPRLRRRGNDVSRRCRRDARRRPRPHPLPSGLCWGKRPRLRPAGLDSDLLTTCVGHDEGPEHPRGIIIPRDPFG